MLLQIVHRGRRLVLQVLEHERQVLLCLTRADLSELEDLQRDLGIGLPAHAHAVLPGGTSDDALHGDVERPDRRVTGVDERAVDVPEDEPGRRHHAGVSVRSSAIRLSTTSGSEPPRSTTSR